MPNPREEKASIGQRVLWQMDHHRGGHGALNCPLLLRLDGPLDVAALQAAIDALALRHEALRTTFVGRGPRLRQLIHAEPLPLAITELDIGEATTQENGLVEAIAGEVQTPTDIGERPIRLTLWKLAAERRVLCMNMHHLTTDGWSTALVANELGRLYRAIVADGPDLPAVDWQYADWAEWHHRQLEGERLRRMRTYWRERLAGAKLPELPRRHSDVPLLERRTNVERRLLDADTVKAMQALARTFSTAFFTCLLAVYYVLLSHETGEGDLAVGSIFANRSRREAQSTVGFLSNMVVLRTRLSRRATFAEVIRAADDTVIGAFSHQELPFQMLPLDTIAAESMRPDAIVFQLFAGPMAPAKIGGVAFEPIIDVPEGIGNRWELELSLAPAPDGLAVLLSYARDLYDGRWASSFLDGYVALASALARRPNIPSASAALAG
ncbi:MAG TPA: condensation domain-containing protein [Solirubrobacteraceae bacterium]|jgi:hypothetical protein|nr:condensation domain-containing protein [Solirubrobacteraceae bacterium]